MNLRPQKDMNLRAQNFYEHKTQKNESKGARRFSATLHRFLNTRHHKFYEPKAPKFYEPQANHVACSANASGGEALRPSPQDPSSRSFLRPTSSTGTAHP